MAGIMEDGFSTTIAFAADATVEMEEIDVTPPGLDAGGLIDTTTMLNTALRTGASRQLKTLTPASITVAYDPAALTKILAMIGVNQLITITFPDGSTWAFWGMVNTFTPGAQTEGERPTATLEIIPTNRNGSKVETPPVYDDGVV
jgi:hypothetical protein